MCAPQIWFSSLTLLAARLRSNLVWHRIRFKIYCDTPLQEFTLDWIRWVGESWGKEFAGFPPNRSSTRSRSGLLQWRVKIDLEADAMPNQIAAKSGSQQSQARKPDLGGTHDNCQSGQQANLIEPAKHLINLHQHNKLVHSYQIRQFVQPAIYCKRI
jgi:hypothetical protein